MHSPVHDAQPGDMQALLDRSLRDFLAKLPDADAALLQDVLRSLVQQPERLGEIQARYYREQLALWSSLLAPGKPVAGPAEPRDQRFAGAEWATVPWFDYLRRSYLLNARWLTELLEAAPLPQDRRKRAAFVLRQWLDALAPTNFAATNPEVIRLASATSGASLRRGLQNLRDDLARGHIQMSDESAFEVGRNLAVTPGAVVYQNPIVQLIQYTPRTPQVRERPLFIVPPFINKYYILDLQPDNSLVRYALERGFQVFMISWRNVPAELGASTWEDYVREGVFAPLQAVREISGADRVNALGFCVGGTLLASAVGVMDERERIASLTLLATMLDFSDVGEIGVYIDPAYVARCEDLYREGGRLPGSVLASTFASLRANELVWFFVINNYLLGKTPRAFDLLYWNSDSANLPGRLYAWYLRQAYLENNLRVPGKVSLCGRPLDLGVISCPAFVLATREDHIVPWRSAYASTQLLAGRIEFALAAGGHIAGIVNPPAAGKREYWVSPATPPEADAWLAQARAVRGSWWPHWAAWLERHSGALVSASPAAGSALHPPREPAPGCYVRENSGRST
jgi:polyhydroxyalkanoate synthase subunit PhaC